MGGENFFARIFKTSTPTENNVRVQEQNEGLLQGNNPNEFKMYINKGQDDQMEIRYYRPCLFRTALTYLSFILTVGVLRLVFHWIPHLYLISTCVKCKINEAKMILIIELFNGKHKIYHVKKLNILTVDSAIKTINEEEEFCLEECEENDMPRMLSVHFEKGEFKNVEKVLTFMCKKVIYIWNDEIQGFTKLTGLDSGVSCDTFHKYTSLSPTENFMRRAVSGPNRILVKESSIITLIFLEVLNPFYIFQILSFILWFSDQYYYYAAAILAMSIFGVGMTVAQTRKNQRNLKSTVHSSDVCTVLRKVPNHNFNEMGDFEYTSKVISTELLVPGDILEIPSHGCVMHCDAVLLTGNCILNESMLTGESVPVTKTALPNLPNIIYDPKEHARHTLFCGTHVIQTRYFGDEKVLAVVVRTGFSTAKGSLVRSILYPPPVDFRFEKDSYRFVILLAAIATIGFIYTVVEKVLKGVEVKELIFQALDLITIVVPPALPAAMSVGRFYAQIRLKNNKIFCISPRTINVSGGINCVCFDKTGTLTEDGLDLLCVVPVDNKIFTHPVKSVDTLQFDTMLYGLVSCHSLTIIDNQIMGDPLDLKMFESTKWILEEQDVDDNNKFNMIFPTVLKPPRDYKKMPDGEELQIGIIREFPFSSSSQRMGVIIRRLNGTNFEYYAKGSPEMILNFVKPDSVPNDFHEILESYTQEGYRVIALAHKELKMSYAKIQKVQRDLIENDLTFLGLIVLENRLKPDTTPCIQQLNEAHIRVIMVTGDNILTAVSVAKDCDIIRPGQSVITVNIDGCQPPNLYYTLTNTKSNKCQNDESVMTNSASVVSMDTVESQINSNSVHNSQYNSSLNNYRFAMTGKTWAAVKEHHAELLPRLCTRGSVFARMAPEQKQQLVQELQGLGYCVAMCGDGANDCGALKAAHAGISLSEAESSVASPFTSKNPDITCVLNVIREGRAALVTSFGIFKYMAAYSLCQFVSVLILYSIESNLTDMEFLYIDLPIITTFAFFFARTEAYSGKLVKETPLSSLISLSPVLSLLLQLFLVIAFQVAAFEHLKLESWYVPFNSTDPNVLKCYENYTIFSVSTFQYITLAIVFSKGYPYRKSIFTNYGFIISSIVMTGISIYLTLGPSEFIKNQFELEVPDDFNFRLYLLAYAAINFIVSILIERFFVDNFLFKKMRFKFHKLDKSKRKYLAIERDLSKDPKWPTLTSDFKSAASPMTSEVPVHAEIVIETEYKYNRNHVLNKLFESGNSGQNSDFNTPNHVLSSNFATPVRRNEKRNETGYFSNEDLFSSLHDNVSTPSKSDTFKSLSNNQSNYDLASSHLNIPEIPYDENIDINIDDDITIAIEATAFDFEKHDGDASNFNHLGMSKSPPSQNLRLEMNDFDVNR